MRHFTWMRVGFENRPWEQHVFPRMSARLCFISLCGMYFGTVDAPSNGDFRCEVCSQLMPEAEKYANDGSGTEPSGPTRQRIALIAEINQRLLEMQLLELQAILDNLKRG